MTVTVAGSATGTPAITRDFGPRRLRCPVASAGSAIPSGPGYVCQECFGPLEVAYDCHRLARAARAIEAGPRNDLALRAAAARARRRRRRTPT